MKTNDLLHTSALLALLTASAYFLADTVDAVIGHSLGVAPAYSSPGNRDRPVLRQRRDLKDFASILERGLFGEGKAPSAAPASAAASSYTLIGTVEGAVFSGAVLADKTGQAFYQLSGKLPDGSTLVKVLRDRVTLRRTDGALEDIELVDDTKIVAARKGGNSSVKGLGNGKFLVDQKEVLASTENMSQLLTQARAMPYVQHGKTAGFRITEIVPNSIYAKIGLQNGDIIQQVNAQALDDPGKFFQLYQGLRNERSISIDLLRNGQRQTLNYDIR
jgi:general secretion pathway protein C